MASLARIFVRAAGDGNRGTAAKTAQTARLRRHAALDADNWCKVSASVLARNAEPQPNWRISEPWGASARMKRASFSPLSCRPPSRHPGARRRRWQPRQWPRPRTHKAALDWMPHQVRHDMVGVQAAVQKSTAAHQRRHPALDAAPCGAMAGMDTGETMPTAAKGLRARCATLVLPFFQQQKKGRKECRR